MAFLHDLYLRAGVGKQVEQNCVVLVSFATKNRACITATLCYYNALSAEWSCALCSGTLIRRNVPPAHSQHFRRIRAAVDVEK